MDSYLEVKKFEMGGRYLIIILEAAFCENQATFCLVSPAVSDAE